jgi:hypothetical protein
LNRGGYSTRHSTAGEGKKIPPPNTSHFAPNKLTIGAQGFYVLLPYGLDTLFLISVSLSLYLSLLIFHPPLLIYLLPIYLLSFPALSFRKIL